MSERKHVIWSDYNLNYEDWRADLESEYPELSDYERYYKMLEINGDYLDDERANLNIQLPRPIIAIADLGLWHGRVMGYHEIQSGNIRDCLYSSCDYNEWYVDGRGDMRCTAVHHDDTNHYLYRVFKDDVTEDQIAWLEGKIYNGVATRADITRLTRRLGDEIGKVYGWDFPQRQPQKREEYER